MKIAFILGKFPAISETFILNQITGLIDLGHEIEIFADKSDENSLIHPEIKKYKLLQETKLFSNIPSNTIIRILKAITLAIRYFPLAPKAVIRSFNFNKYGWVASSLRLIYILKPFVGNAQVYDIVHCHFRGNGMRAVFLKDAGLINGKIVTVFHGADVTATLKGHGIKSVKYLLENGNLFLPISDTWRRELIAQGAPKNRTIVHRMGVNSPVINDVLQLESNNGFVHIISICRLTEKKGIKYSIQAISKLQKIYNNFHYDIIGDGPLRDELVSLCNRLELSDVITFHGAMNKSDVQNMLSKSHILLQPSVTARDGDQEGIPVSIMEGMAYGLPVISTWHSGIPELVTNGESGILVKERDVSGLVEAMSKLTMSTKLRDEMGLKGRQFICENYNIENLNRRLELLFNKLIIE